MGNIVNDSFSPGETITGADLNAKFSDVVSETTANLDAVNVRAEGVDISTLNLNDSDGRSGLVLRSIATEDNEVTPAGPMGTYECTPGPDLSPASVGVPFTHGSVDPTDGLQTGAILIPEHDLVRVHWQVWMDLIQEVGGSARSGTPPVFGGVAPTVGESPWRHPVWLVWLQWSSDDITWSAVPGQSDFDTEFGGVVRGAVTTDTNATMVIPHATLLVNRTGAPWAHDPAVGFGVWATDKYLSSHRSWNYQNTTGGPITKYFRLVIDGIYHPQNDATVGDVNALIHEDGEWCDAQPDPSDNQIDIGNVHLGVLVMRST